MDTLLLFGKKSSVWVFEGDRKSSKLGQVKSVGKQMIAYFLFKTGLVCTFPLEQQKTINAN